MTIKNRTTYTLASTFGLVLALATSSSLASAISYDGDGGDEESPKSVACAAIGCPDGGRECAKASGTIKGGVPPWSGEISVQYTCYEGVFR